MKIKFLKVVYAGLVLLSVMFLSLIYKNYNLQKDFYEKGNSLKQENKLIPAIDAYERVILAYIPLSPYNDKAISEIQILCNKLISYDRLYCLETLKAALFQIQSFYQPYSRLREKTTEEIIRLRTQLYMKDLNIPQDKEEEIFSIMDEITRKEFNPDKFWSFLVPVTLIGWIGLVIAGIWYRKVYYFLGAGISFIIWIISLYMA